VIPYTQLAFNFVNSDLDVKMIELLLNPIIQALVIHSLWSYKELFELFRKRYLGETRHKLELNHFLMILMPAAIVTDLWFEIDLMKLTVLVSIQTVQPFLSEYFYRQQNKGVFRNYLGLGLSVFMSLQLFMFSSLLFGYNQQQ
jgi:hypothetical protein